jgi:regulator of protease activity HflC (stomatin/prohibitin superfamily)
VPTRDGMIIDKLELTVRYRLGVGVPPQSGPARRAASGQFEYKPDLLRTNHWRDTPDSYKETVKKVAEGVARAAISSYDLHEIAILPGPMREKLEEQLRNGIQRRLNPDGDWVNVQRTSLGKITIPREAYNELVQRWVAEMQAGTSRIRAEADRDIMILRSEAQVSSFRALEKVKSAVRKDLIDQSRQLIETNPDLAQRYLEAVESLAGYLTQDNAQALHVVESLEAMARNSKSFNLYLGASDLLQKNGIVTAPPSTSDASSPEPPQSVPPSAK